MMLEKLRILYQTAGKRECHWPWLGLLKPWRTPPPAPTHTLPPTKPHILQQTPPNSATPSRPKGAIFIQTTTEGDSVLLSLSFFLGFIFSEVWLTSVSSSGLGLELYFFFLREFPLCTGGEHVPYSVLDFLNMLRSRSFAPLIVTEASCLARL